MTHRTVTVKNLEGWAVFKGQMRRPCSGRCADERTPVSTEVIDRTDVARSVLEELFKEMPETVPARAYRSRMRRLGKSTVEADDLLGDIIALAEYGRDMNGNIVPLSRSGGRR